MISKPKIGVSDSLTGLQVGLPQDDNFLQSLLGKGYFSADTVAVDAAFTVPLPTPCFAYTTADWPLKPDNLNGLIIDNDLTNSELTTRLPVARHTPSGTTTQGEYAWLPLIDNGQLRDPVLRENFIICVTALHELNNLRKQTLTRHALIDFHSRYKLVLLAHDQPGYREIGPFVAAINEWQDLEEFFVIYRKKLMNILQQPASRENHVNAMMHIQGYFNRQITAEQRRELCDVIHNYRLGHLPINAPLTKLKRYLSQYPNGYLATQQYFKLYPNNWYLN